MQKVRWGVIGAGGIADRRTIPGMMLAKNAELISVMEISKEFAGRVRAKYNAAKAYDNEDDLLGDNDIDAVYIASPVSCHYKQVLKAAAAGKHILIEKPLALNSKEAQKAVDACRKSGVLLAAGFMMRYHAYHRKMKEIIESGRLGKVVSCRSQLTCWYPDIPGAWRQSEATSGGGALMDMGIHCIDLIQYITGGKTIRAVGFSGTKTFRYEVEDSSSTILELDNGAYVYIDANFNIPDAAARGRLEIYGTKGSMLAEGTISQAEGGKLDVMMSDDSLAYDAAQERTDVSPVRFRVKFGNMYTKEIESFSRSILEGNPPEVPGEDAVQVQRVIEAAYESQRKGRIISC